MMFAKNLLLVAIATIGAATNTYAGWLPQACVQRCTQVTCHDPLKMSQCEENCKNSPQALAACKTAMVKEPTQENLQLAKPVEAPKSTAKASVRKLPSTLSTKMAASKPQASVPDEPAVEQKAKPASSEGKTLNPDSEKFFKQFGADLTSALNIDRCVYKSITLDKNNFETNSSKTLKSRLVKDKNKFKNYEEYISRLKESAESMLFTDLKDMLKEITAHWVKAGTIVYDSQIRGVMIRAIRTGSQIAPKIPSYTFLDTAKAGTDMYGPYVKALPENVLVDLKKCVMSNTFSTPEVTKLKDEFVNAITGELAQRGMENLASGIKKGK